MFKRFMLLAVTATMMCFAAQAQKFGYVNTGLSRYGYYDVLCSTGSEIRLRQHR